MPTPNPVPAGQEADAMSALPLAAPPAASSRTGRRRLRATTSIDMRCSAVFPVIGTSPADEVPRCQLLAGHDGEHAVMYADEHERRVLVWTGDRSPAAADDDWMRLPWMRGLPVPAWFDTDG